MAVNKHVLEDTCRKRLARIKEETDIGKLEALIDKELGKRYVPGESIRISIDENLFDQKEFADLRIRYRRMGWSVMLGANPPNGRCVIFT